jgi:hypothetical protein
MNELRDELRRKWREAAATPRAGYEWRGVALEVIGPIRFVASVREPDDRIALLLEGPLKAAPMPPYRVMADGLSVTDQRRPEEGIFRIAVVLEQDGLRDVFEVLAADVVCRGVNWKRRAASGSLARVPQGAQTRTLHGEPAGAHW